MASTNFINECKNNAYMNRYGKVSVTNSTKKYTNSDLLQEINIEETCYADDMFIGSACSKSATIKVLNTSSEEDNLIDNSVNIQVGVKYDGSTNPEYIDLGLYKIERPNDEVTNNLLTLNAYDTLNNKLDSEYVCGIDYSTGNKTLSNLYQDVCNNLGLTPVTLTFTNSTIPISNNPFTNKETNRIVLQTIAKISCSWIKMEKSSGKIDIGWLSNSNTPDYTFQKNDYSTVDGGNITYGPINSLVIKNSQIDSENVSTNDPQSISTYGEHILTISEDYILNNATLRQQALTAIWNKVHNLKYVDYTLKATKGKPFLELGNKVRIYTDDDEYFDSYIFTHKFTYDGAFYSEISAKAQTEQQISMKQNTSLGKALRNTQVIVNKQEGKITAVVDKVEDITTPIGNISGNSIHIEDAENTSAIELDIDGKSSQKQTTTGNNIFDEDKYKNATYATNVYKYVQTDILGNGTLYFKAKLKEGKTHISGFYLCLCSKTNPNLSGNQSLWAIHSGAFSTKNYQTFTNNTNLYFTYYPTTVTVENIFNTYNFWVSTNDIDYEPFIPNSPSPEYPSEIDTIKNTIQVKNEGTTATTYEPYQETISNIDLKDNELCSIGDTKDELIIENGRAKIIKKIGKVVLNGSESWVFNEAGTGYVRYTLFIDDLFLVSTSDRDKYFTISNKFVSSTQNQTVNANADANRICIVTNKRLLIKTLNTSLSNVNLFKQWLSENKPIVYYILATPQEIILQDLDVELFKGVNNIELLATLDTNMYLTYVRDTAINSYVEGQIKTEQIIRQEKINELEITEEGISNRVGVLETDYQTLNGLYTGIDAKITPLEARMETINKSIDSDGNVTSVRIKQGMKFDEEGLDFYTSDNDYNTQITNTGVYFKDGQELVAEATKDGFMAIDFKQKGQNFYNFNGENYDFVAERIELNGYYGYAHFYNGGEE